MSVPELSMQSSCPCPGGLAVQFLGETPVEGVVERVPWGNVEQAGEAGSSSGHRQDGVLQEHQVG